jgi:hypothetical protein
VACLLGTCMMAAPSKLWAGESAPRSEPLKRPRRLHVNAPACFLYVAVDGDRSHAGWLVATWLKLLVYERACEGRGSTGSVWMLKMYIPGLINALRFLHLVAKDRKHAENHLAPPPASRCASYDKVLADHHADATSLCALLVDDGDAQLHFRRAAPRPALLHHVWWSCVGHSGIFSAVSAARCFPATTKPRHQVAWTHGPEPIH